MTKLIDVFRNFANALKTMTHTPIADSSWNWCTDSASDRTLDVGWSESVVSSLPWRRHVGSLPSLLSWQRIRHLDPGSEYEAIITRSLFIHELKVNVFCVL